MNYFDNSNIKLDILKKKAYNLRWAEVADGTIPLTAADMDYPCAPAIKQALLAYSTYASNACLIAGAHG